MLSITRKKHDDQFMLPQMLLLLALMIKSIIIVHGKYLSVGYELHEDDDHRH